MKIYTLSHVLGNPKEPKNDNKRQMLAVSRQRTQSPSCLQSLTCREYATLRSAEAAPTDTDFNQHHGAKAAAHHQCVDHM